LSRAPCAEALMFSSRASAISAMRFVFSGAESGSHQPHIRCAISDAIGSRPQRANCPTMSL